MPATNAVIDTGKAAVNSATSVADLIAKLTNPSNLKNVGIFALGIGLSITGLLILFASTKEAKAVEGMATKGIA